jgi:hypothetical protein
LARRSVRRFIPILLVIGVVVVLALTIAARLTAARAAQPTPADVLMQSVVARDGELGWKQLCPSLQAQVSPRLLADTAQSQRAAEAGQHLSMSVELIGARAQPKGGEFRFYLVTASRPDGSVLQRPYTLATQPGGCVEEVY